MASFLPHYLTMPGVWIDILPIPIGAAVLALIASLATIKVKYNHPFSLGERWMVFLSFSLLGFVIGDLTGQSREAAVPATIGATLGLLGGAMVYLLGSRGPKQQVFVSIAVGLLLIAIRN